MRVLTYSLAASRTLLSSSCCFFITIPSLIIFLVLAWFHDVHSCLLASLALLAGLCCLPEEQHWSLREACCAASPDTKPKTVRSGPRVLRIVCSARRACLDTLSLSLASLPSKRALLLEAAGWCTAMLARVHSGCPSDVAGEVSSQALLIDSSVSRSSFACCLVNSLCILAEEVAFLTLSVRPRHQVAPNTGDPSDARRASGLWTIAAP